jgi:transcriptional regulator
MARESLDAQIDKLYQLSLDEFTPARNALAKETGEAALKKLEKPNLAAWAVNQLYWQARTTYDDFIESAERMRAEYRKQLGGKSANVTIAEGKHKAALQKAKQTIRELLEKGGASASESVMTSVAETLDALPGTDPPGRLTKSLRRMGFGALDGVPIVVAPKKVKPEQPPVKDEKAEREHAMARERLRFAEAAEREAQAAVEKAQRALERAEATHDRIKGELEEAATTVNTSKKEVAAAEAGLKKATSSLRSIRASVS